MVNVKRSTTVRQNLDKFQSSLDDRNLVGLENTVGHVIW